ncbi:hypothetical protein PHLGIDRAFT_206381 [Phlebiopsis gigantea 11061_1 CR5-6]|uniref:non-specific serine/threonine protein kinase n=1 Tax=Phlebiopsis gigantea (strain 11061_1 CR5-6) TaxID=745531 RepID=A0A0C3S306_PHLG1|nr:hypothetical protein PHLGIDRAFT_206381 [Phlebiopsis gigantea 11061_1 CR5-6]
MGGTLSINKGLSCLRSILTSLTMYWSPASHPSATQKAALEPSDFFVARRGDCLQGRYRIQVKLGGGVHSNTFLVVDERNAEKPSYRAVKVLSRDATRDCLGGDKYMLEVDVMQRLRESGEHDTLPHLRDMFEIYEAKTPVHICLVMDVLGSDLGAFRRLSPNKSLPPYTVRVIVKQILDALAHLHSIGIVHTDIKPDNMLFRTWMGDDDISKWLRGIPFNKDVLDDSHPLDNLPSVTWNCPPHVAQNIKVALVDLGSAQLLGQPPTVNQFSAFSLRAPEVILHSDFTPAVDIWAIGCIVFEMLVGRWLFHPVDGGEDWSLEDDHLAKMMEFTGERFPQDMITRAQFGSDYFDKKGSLHRVSDLFPVSIEDALRNYDILSSEEIGPAADFIRACIRLDPRDRPTAKELASHPWLRFFPASDDPIRP